ncbi:hypothetical protein CAPTEDRAFT_204974 [Capitella teleta]|uniref:Uncharacterized protein n=1 Tax=Capitella teleta TaxID=283909 RepID=R7T666_CAPTE|nr:hypothetical protein CAPTEDRAFT_204974 [Capitella teleta]|eukprot:ELT88900.1 hypothetical protein CAPTEDRAFT_204974 [Capitella teleta]
MKAILLIVLLHSAIAQQSEEDADRRVSQLEVRLGQVEQAMQSSAAISPHEEHQSCDFASSMVRDFNQLHLELRDQDARVMESQLLEMRQIVQSAVDHFSATEKRIATANAATEDRLVSMTDRINDLGNTTTGSLERVTFSDPNKDQYLELLELL